jgi:hypothetical protein
VREWLLIGAGIVGIVAVIVIVVAVWAETRKPGSLFGEHEPDSWSLRVLTSAGDVAMWVLLAVAALLVAAADGDGGNGNGNGSASEKSRRRCAYCGASAAHNSKICECGRMLPSGRDEEHVDDPGDGTTRLNL